MRAAEVIVIGSGPAGVQASAALLAAGKTVLMLDGGKEPPLLPEAPDANFEDIRRRDSAQATWFLGDDLSGIPVSGLTGGLGGGQVSGNRAYVTADAGMLLPIIENGCQIIQSLAEGGLGASWGAACALPTEGELWAMGLGAREMERYLDSVLADIGVSGPPVRPGIQKPLPPDLHASLALQAYERRKTTLRRMRLSVTQPLCAILTEDKDGRKASTLADMEYWADPGRSVYRPQYTLEELKKNGLFCFTGGCIVEKIIPDADGCTVTARMMSGGEGLFRGRRVILAAGAIGSARIALRSAGFYGTPLPFAAKPHVFSACLHPATLGHAGPKLRSSLCQLLVLDDEERSGSRAGCAQLYSYRSLLLFRLLQSQPLPCPEAMRVLSLLAPALVIADIRFPALPEHGSVSLVKTADGDALQITCSVPAEEHAARRRSWRRLRKTLRMLGLLPVRNMELPEGSASHYAGTLPMSDSDKMLTTDRLGKLRGLPHVSVADGAVFPSLPSVPHTLTLMANARRIAEAVAADLR